ncbi:MAG: nucleotide exchange factor GrpE [bacterium]|nr:nucleotide exchange factor GrpE [bacterium]
MSHKSDEHIEKKEAPPEEKEGEIKKEEKPSADKQENKAKAPEENIEQHKKKLEEKTKESHHNLELAKRIKAEFENYKKRIAKDHEENIKLANEDLMTELFPVMICFENALKKNDLQDEKFKSFYTGIELIYKEMSKILAKYGLTEISPCHGEKFDPAVCEGVLAEESDKFKEDVILELLEKGCRISNKLIKPARVKVGKPAQHQVRKDEKPAPENTH